MSKLSDTLELYAENMVKGKHFKALMYAAAVEAQHLEDTIDMLENNLIELRSKSEIPTPPISTTGIGEPTTTTGDVSKEIGAAYDEGYRHGQNDGIAEAMRRHNEIIETSNHGEGF
jgi:hypothetical protein